MKLKALLIASLLANIALVGAFSLSKIPSSQDAPKRSDAGQVQTPSANASSPEHAGNSPAAAIPPDLWSRLYTKDLPSLVENLRAAGFPSRLVRSLVSMELQEQYAEKRKALLGDVADRPIWQLRNPAMDPAKLAQMQVLYREQSETLKKLLGNEATGSASEANSYLPRTYGNISAEKIEAIQRMTNDYNEMRNQVYSESLGVMLPEDREKMTILDKEKRADLEAILSPEELAEYDMRNSPTMARMRSQFGNFDLTEQEFYSIFAATKQVYDRFNPRNPDGTRAPMVAVSAKDRREAQERLKEQMQQIMGEARYQEYQKSNDPVLRVATQLATRLQLPAESANAVYMLKQATENQAKAIRADAGLSKQDKDAALKHLSTQASSQIEQLLTPRGAAAFKQSAGANWLRSIDRTATPRSNDYDVHFSPGY